MNTHEYIRKAKAKHGDRYDYSLVVYSRWDAKVDIICAQHGVFSIRANNLLAGKGCKRCYVESIPRSTTEEFARRAREVHGDRYDYSLVSYRNSKTKVCIICKEHGEYYMSPSNHLAGHGCRMCANDSMRSTTEEFVRRAREVHGDRYDYSFVDYKSDKGLVVVICKEHGEFMTKPNSHIFLRNGCPRCRRSKGEAAIASWLAAHAVSFREQERFCGCRNVYPLPFDFWIPASNVAIEYNGEQHRSGRFYKFNKKIDLEERRRLDSIKRDFCSSNKITLIEISSMKDIDKVLEGILL